MDKTEIEKLDKQYAQLAMEEKYRRQIKLMQNIDSGDSSQQISIEQDNSIEPDKLIEQDNSTEPDKLIEQENSIGQDIPNEQDSPIEPDKTNDLSNEQPEAVVDSPVIQITLGNIKEKIPFFIGHKSFGPKLIEYWEKLEACIPGGDMRAANLLITSIPGNGKSSLATQLATAVIGASRNSVSDCYCHIDSEDFNRRDIGDLYRKYSQGVIFIENASKISDESLQSLRLLTEVGDKHPLIILELLPEEKEGFFARMDFLGERFANELHIPVFDDPELAEFAVYYAGTQNFLIDNMALLKIHSLIINTQSFTHHVNLAEMVSYVDDAIEVSGKRLIKRLFFSKTQRELETPVLTENDFKQRY